MFDGSIDAERYLARVWQGYSGPGDHEFLVYGVGERPTGGLYPVARMVVGGPERAGQLCTDYDADYEETHGGVPIFRVDYAGRD